MMSRSVAMITRRDYEYYDVEDGFLDCQVESLEVYRGRQQATKISHGGFSISENGSIEVVAFIYLTPCNAFSFF